VGVYNWAFETPRVLGLNPDGTQTRTMTIIGHARVSTTDQDLDIQVAALKRRVVRIAVAPATAIESGGENEPLVGISNQLDDPSHRGSRGRTRRVGDLESPQDRPGVGLPGAPLAEPGTGIMGERSRQRR
jgi:hypothetical protein